MKKILFVCTGNTCRSPMAEGILREEIAKDLNLSNEYIVTSAGVAAFDGDSASSHSIEALQKDYGIDISNHRSRSITKYEAEEAYLILTMSKSHKKAITRVMPEISDKVFTLKEYVATDSDTKNIDISDPYGMPVEVYKQCAAEIKSAVDKVIKML